MCTGAYITGHKHNYELNMGAFWQWMINMELSLERMVQRSSIKKRERENQISSNWAYLASKTFVLITHVLLANLSAHKLTGGVGGCVPTASIRLMTVRNWRTLAWKADPLNMVVWEIQPTCSGSLRHSSMGAAVKLCFLALRLHPTQPACDRHQLLKKELLIYF